MSDLPADQSAGVTGDVAAAPLPCCLVLGPGSAPVEGCPEAYPPIDPSRLSRLLPGQQRILEGLAHDAPLTATLQAIVDLIESEAPGMMASILLANPAGTMLVAGVGPHDRAIRDFVAEHGVPIAEGATICGTAAFRRAPVVVADMLASPLTQSVRTLLEQARLRGCCSAPILNASGQILGTFAMYFTEPRGPTVDECALIRFATHVTALAINIQRKANEVYQAQRLEGLGRLAGGVAHDFNNLLTPILGYTSLVRMSLPADSSLNAPLLKVEDAAKKAGELCRQLLAYSGRSARSAGLADIGDVVRETVGLVCESLPPDAELDLQLPEDATPVWGDPRELSQVAMNLIWNAADALGDQPGRIAISVRRGDAQAALAVLDHRNGVPVTGDAAILAVTDTGRGIEPHLASRVFDPFFSTKSNGQGLGLATTLGIVRSHGGSIGFSSTPDRGSTFVVVLPLQEERQATASL